MAPHCGSPVALTVFELSKPLVLGPIPPFPEASFWDLGGTWESVTELETRLLSFGGASHEPCPLITFPALFLEKYFFVFQNPDQMDPFKPSLTQADLDIPLRSSHGTHHSIMRLCICMFISLLLVSSIWTQILFLLVCPPMSVCSLSKAWCVGNNQKVCVDWLNEWMFLLGSKRSIKERAGPWVPLPVSSSTN